MILPSKSTRRIPVQSLNVFPANSVTLLPMVTLTRSSVKGEVPFTIRLRPIYTSVTAAAKKRPPERVYVYAAEPVPSWTCLLPLPKVRGVSASSITTLVNAVQSLKALLPMLSTEAGIVMVGRLVQPSKALIPISAIFSDKVMPVRPVQ